MNWRTTVTAFHTDKRFGRLYTRATFETNHHPHSIKEGIHNAIDSLDVIGELHEGVDHVEVSWQELDG